MVVLTRISYGIARLNTPVTVAFNMKQTVDAFFDSAGQKKLTERSRKRCPGALMRPWRQLQAWQREHHAVILVSPAVYRARGYHPGDPAGYCPADEGRA
nr:type-F conjugative transfer system protein TrbI [Salmonella enterica]